MSVFNPNEWKKELVVGITEEQIAELDERYINLGENIYDQNINNLNVVNLRVGSQGSIYFNGDNTTQITAFQPNFVTNQINAFKDANNKFTSENIFNDLQVEDTAGNKSKIYQSGNNLLIENTETGNITFRTNNINSSISSSGVLTCNEINTPSLKCDSLSILNDYNIYRNFGGSLIFDNLRNGAEIVFQTKQTNGNSGWSLVFNPSGLLYGMNNTISHTIETKAYKFRDNNLSPTLSQLYLSPTNDLIFDNRLSGVNSKMKFNNYNSLGTVKTITLDENMNSTGTNNLDMTGRLKMGNITHEFSNNQYIIDNKNNGSSIIIKNYDNGGILKQIELTPTMNMTGINDLYAQRLYLNNVLLNLTAYDALINRAQQIQYATNQTTIEHNNGKIGFLSGAINESSKNPIIQNNDNAIIGYNTSQSNSVLSLCSWNNSSTGIRLTNTETQMYKPKVMDTLTFSDGTTQSSAVTQSLINTLVANAVNQIIPSGTIFAYGKTIQLTNGVPPTPPTGFLWCIGEIAYQNIHPNLFNAIGHTYAYGRILPDGQFYLPDFRGAVLKGCFSNTNFSVQTAITNAGQYQQQNVGYHKHQFSDHRSSQNFDMVGFTAGVKHGLSTQLTSGNTFDANTNALLDAENRVNSVGVNYIIKI